MKKNNKLIFFLICILIFFLVLNIHFFFKIWSIVEIREIDASVIVSDRIGFDVNQSSLIFGKVPIGSSSTRQVSIENNFEFPVKVYVYSKGDMKRFVRGSVTEINIGERKNINVIVVVPENIDFGKYEGKVVFEMRKNSSSWKKWGKINQKNFFRLLRKIKKS